MDILLWWKEKERFPPSIDLMDCVFLSRELTSLFQAIFFSSSGYVEKKFSTCTLAQREQNIWHIKVNQYTYTDFLRKLGYSNNIVNMVLSDT